MHTNSPLNLDRKKLEKIRSSYSALQIVTIFSVSLSVVLIITLGYYLLFWKAGIGFLIFVLAWNLPTAIMVLKRPAIGYYAALIYCLPSLPSVLGLIVFVMLFRTKPFFGKNRVTIREVNEALDGDSSAAGIAQAVPALNPH
ncbi:MAG: hypothetical protein JNK37_14975 [Verrucomicrobiales bacterium]|nr:hypothetical protein [Verrucomicrobiales bacterium]